MTTFHQTWRQILFENHFDEMLYTELILYQSPSWKFTLFVVVKLKKLYFVHIDRQKHHQHELAIYGQHGSVR